MILARKISMDWKIFILVVMVFPAATVYFCILPSVTRCRPVRKGYESKESTERNKSTPPTETSILRDSYYTLQPEEMDNLTAHAPIQKMCFRVPIAPHHILCPYQSDYMSENMKNGANVDRADIILRLLRHTPNAAFIDVGANVGSISIPIMKQLDSSRRFLFVEPNRDNIRSLVLAIRHNAVDFSNWAVIPRAMWNTTDDTMTWTSVWNSSNGYLDVLHNNDYLKLAYENSAVQRVQTATFDSHVLPVAVAMGITHAIAKIDIEGAECVAMQKAQQFLWSIHIPYIFMEYWPAADYGNKNWPCIEQLLSVMGNFSYHPFSATRNQLLDINAYRGWKDIDIIWKKIL